ncbi:hypothetical protein QSJ19_26115 [Gordonia sp. ABSL11-1]|uniref:hypothetical protein n=1 Tax=Gordonia sp. ABSL11-1 TaxID=3053924 RepID=UPI002573BCBC|nr:hypothetical protein [Gordonia sp. ABSL11-1]MDL9948993.1 hypothetical protein [Gordonia sp. ABSL11-1]
MTNDAAGPEEVRRRFEDLIATMDPRELPALLGTLSRAATDGRRQHDASTVHVRHPQKTAAA